jgi:hypothetical protein
MARGSLVPNVKYVLVPNRRPPSKEGDLFTDNIEALSDAGLVWLAEQHLQCRRGRPSEDPR